MNFYTLTSKMYDLLDVLYFGNKEKSPRTAINNLITRENAEILDLCCGTMANSIPIARRHKNAQITGIDISEKMLQVADKKLKKNAIQNVFIKCADATDTSLKSDSFDYIIIGLVLHELSPELQKQILAEAHRLLKNDGLLIVMEWEKPKRFRQKVKYVPLYVSEQLLCSTFKQFYNCDKELYFRQNSFAISEILHCSYTAVISMKKCNRQLSR